MVRRFGLEPAEELASARGPQELVALARHSAKEGALEADTAELFVRTLNLADLTAENVMTPRVQVIALDVQATARTWPTRPARPACPASPSTAAASTRSSASRTSRTSWPCPPSAAPAHPVAELLREPLLVPESLTVDRLLDRLSGKRTMAVVIDEYGGTAGVATLEDIVEEVVGEVRDEHDPHETPDLAPAGDGRRGPRALLGRRRRPHRPAGADRAARCPRARTRRSPVSSPPSWAASRPSATRVEVAGWRLDVVDASGPPGRAGAAARTARRRTDDAEEDRADDRRPAAHRPGDPGRQRLLRRRRVRADLRAPQPDRAVRRSRATGGRAACCGAWSTCPR